ncbi:hypothetical protein Tco_0103782 [Tanacetum coccineum]
MDLFVQEKLYPEQLLLSDQADMRVRNDIAIIVNLILRNNSHDECSGIRHLMHILILHISYECCQSEETVDKETHMAEPNNYITATQKNFVSNDNEGRMVKKCIFKIQGTFLEKIRNDAFNGNKGENAYEHINKFLDVVGPIKINGLTQDRFRLSIFPISLTGAAYEWFTKECMGSIATWDSMVEKFIMKFHHLSDHNDDEDVKEEEDPNETNNAPKIFMIEGNLFDFETPLYMAFNEFNCLLKIDIDLFTYDI